MESQTADHVYVSEQLISKLINLSENHKDGEIRLKATNELCMILNNDTYHFNIPSDQKKKIDTKIISCFRKKLKFLKPLYTPTKGYLPINSVEDSGYIDAMWRAIRDTFKDLHINYRDIIPANIDSDN